MAAAPFSAAESSSTPTCAICWDDLTRDCGRTVVTLQCNHKFHLDCIGSAFNSFGAMRCPLCRATENGCWVIPGERADAATSEEDEPEPEPEPEYEEYECIDWDLFPRPEGLTARVLLCRVFPPNSQSPTLASVNGNGSPRVYHRYIRASDIIDELNQNWNQPLTTPFCPLPSHFLDGNHTRVPFSTRSSSRSLSEGVVDNNSVLERFVIDPSGSNGPTHPNVDYMATSSNSRSPAVHAMMYGGGGSSGLSGRVPADNAAQQSEQTQFLFNVPLNNTPAIQQHQQSPSIVHPEALETNHFAPSPFMRAVMFGQSGFNDFSQRVPADNAARQSEQTQFLFNVPLNNTPAVQQHQQLPSIFQPEAQEINNVDPSLFMGAMMFGQSGFNDFPQRVPADNEEGESEQSQFLFNVPLNNAPAIQWHQQLPSIVQLESQETNNVASSSFMHAMMFGEGGSSFSLGRVPARFATLQAEQSEYFFNAPLNPPTVWHHQEPTLMVQPEAQERDIASPSRDSSDDIDLTLRM